MSKFLTQCRLWSGRMPRGPLWWKGSPPPHTGSHVNLQRNIPCTVGWMGRTRLGLATGKIGAVVAGIWTLLAGGGDHSCWDGLQSKVLRNNYRPTRWRVPPMWSTHTGSEGHIDDLLRPVARTLNGGTSGKSGLIGKVRGGGGRGSFMEKGDPFLIYVRYKRAWRG